MPKKSKTPKKSKQTASSSGASITTLIVSSSKDDSPSTSLIHNKSQYGSSKILHRSTSHTSSQASLSSLADVDHRSVTETLSSSSKKTKKLTPGSMVRLSRQRQQAKETEGDDLWSWITAVYANAPPGSTFSSLVTSSDHNSTKQQQGIDESQDDKKKRANTLWSQKQRSGSTRLRRRDWISLIILTIMAISVRLWRMDTLPREVIEYDNEIPFMVMRTAMAVMGALCAPMAYVTLKNRGQSAPTAILAALLLTFAGSVAMSTKLPGVMTILTLAVLAGWDLWSMKSDESMDSKKYAIHLVTRLVAIAAFPMVVYISIYYFHFQLQIKQPYYVDSIEGDYDMNLLSPIYRHSLQSPYAEDQLEPVWSDIVYGSVIQLQSETQPPMYVHSPYAYWPKGSGQLQVAAYEYPDLSNHWIVIRANTTYSNNGENQNRESDDTGEIPARLQYLYHGDLLRLRHVAHRHCLHSHDIRTMSQSNDKRHCEISAYGSAMNNFDDNQDDWWQIEIVDIDGMRMTAMDIKGFRVKALETAFRLKHVSQQCYLHLTGDQLEESIPGGAGRIELSCLKDAAVMPSSIWRFSMNDHDYLPAETKLATYPTVSFWKKFKEIHSLVLTKRRAFDSSLDVDDRTISRYPLNWPFQSVASSTLLIWRNKTASIEIGEKGHVRQISLVPNTVSWAIRTSGLVLFFGFHILSAIRHRFGYFDGQTQMEFNQYHLSNAGCFFTAWILHYLPLLALGSIPSLSFNYRDYFPALYFNILMSCTLLSGVMNLSAMSRITRAVVWAILSLTILWSFVQLSPLTFGYLMSPQECETLAAKINTVPISNPGYGNDAQGYHSHPRLNLNCATWKAYYINNLHIYQNTSDFDVYLQYKKLTELHKAKPTSRIYAPILESIFPDTNEALPMQNVFMTPCQRPPQLWEDNQQEGEPNEFQKQQMQYIIKKMEKEHAEKMADKGQQNDMADGAEQQADKLEDQKEIA
ncbi:hypothetical protein FBU30_007979 [Linnemannia zychae]|nr:hypothetical protein FBU30_007979 [Linnemannia zychae]